MFFKQLSKFALKKALHFMKSMSWIKKVFSGPVSTQNLIFEHFVISFLLRISKTLCVPQILFRIYTGAGELSKCHIY